MPDMSAPDEVEAEPGPGRLGDRGAASSAEADDDASDPAEASGMAGLEAALASGNGPDPADVRATLGNVASGLAEQLSSITEEMNKIRQELYGEQGIGGIASELERLKGLGGLLD